jgi:AcrR family transcriptional regulator
VASDKRDRLVQAAAAVVHERGFNRSTLADIAERAEIPVGNVYYYFKTKEAIGEALVGQYAAIYYVARVEWERHADPRKRIAAFIDANVSDRDVLAKSGCPIGTLNAELCKEPSPLADNAARLFADLLGWLSDQFAALGRPPKQARGLAVHVLSAVQGVALLAHTFNDPDLVTDEAKHLKKWIQSL